ncbi:hypothetical protein DICVIV_13718 [Dictyocaulus viviparus]|uniref:Uncharacterized protein n=1 Tax=Dictyocaulus viviparus TaxID=29172 RepID=A0A0D8XD40_DICVI|nr:hypothetical protein DICVIV_13718 [Dictyocaulus viviparus]
MLLELILVLPTSLASICPLKSHQVCNIVNYEDHHYSHNQCTCAITAASDRPAPEQSCTNLIRRDKHNNTFPVISLIFNLRNSPDINEFPEISFRETIAGALRVHPADILLLRVNCQGSENMLTVQFGILKKVNRF